MKLIFEKSEGIFGKELKEAIGFIDADFKFRKMRQDIRSATKELIDIIGQPTYDHIETEYQKEDDDQGKDKTLIEMAQAAIGLQAYRYFAPANDLAHTPNGRKMRNSEDEANPFPWMVDKNDDENQRRAFRAIDDLIAYLDENVASWKTSDAYKETHKHFIRSTKEFDQFYSINSRLLLMKLAPGIDMTEKSDIASRLGIELYNSLKEKRKNNTPLNPNEENLILLIQKACAYSSLAWGLPRLQMTLFPEGILFAYRSDRSTTNARKPSEQMHVDSMAQKFSQDADRALKEIEEHITEHYTPEEEDEDPFDVQAYADKNFNDDDTFVNT